MTVKWRPFGPDAATIVKEFRAGRCTENGFDKFIEGRTEWLDPSRYKEDTLRRNFKKTIARYKAWKAGGKFFCPCFVCQLPSLTLF